MLCRLSQRPVFHNAQAQSSMDTIVGRSGARYLIRERMICVADVNNNGLFARKTSGCSAFLRSLVDERQLRLWNSSGMIVVPFKLLFQWCAGLREQIFLKSWFLGFEVGATSGLHHDSARLSKKSYMKGRLPAGGQLITPPPSTQPTCLPIANASHCASSDYQLRAPDSDPLTQQGEPA